MREEDNWRRKRKRRRRRRRGEGREGGREEVEEEEKEEKEEQIITYPSQNTNGDSLESRPLFYSRGPTGAEQG